MSKRNAKDIFNLSTANEDQTLFDLTADFSASEPHNNRFSLSDTEYENIRKIEKTEETANEG